MLTETSTTEIKRFKGVTTFKTQRISYAWSTLKFILYCYLGCFFESLSAGRSEEDLVALLKQ